jgi:hypothetical protein
VWTWHGHVDLSSVSTFHFTSCWIVYRLLVLQLPWPHGKQHCVFQSYCWPEGPSDLHRPFSISIVGT